MSEPGKEHPEPLPNKCCSKQHDSTVPCEILRDSHSRDGKPGAEWTKDERQMYKDRVASFFESMEAKTTKRRRKTFGRQQPRIASLQWMQMLDHVLHIGVQRRLQQFQVDDATFVKLQQSASSDTTSAPPPCLSIISDQQSVQMSAMNFLTFHCRVNCLHIRDPAHRAWNDMVIGIKKGGFWPVVVSSTVIFNLHYGPWASAAWHAHVKSAVLEMQKVLAPDDELLAHFWQDICTEAEIPREVWKDAEVKNRFLQGLADTKLYENKGAQVSMARWFSWVHAAEFWRSSWTTRLLILMFMNLMRGDLKSAQQVWKNNLAEGGAVIESDKAPEHQTAVPPTTAAKHDMSLAELRKSSANTMLLSIRLLADHELKCKVGILLELARGFSIAHGQALQTLRDEKSCITWYAGMAAGEWLEPFHSAISKLSEVRALERCGFQVHLDSSTKQDKLLA